MYCNVAHAGSGDRKLFTCRDAVVEMQRVLPNNHMMKKKVSANLKASFKHQNFTAFYMKPDSPFHSLFSIFRNVCNYRCVPKHHNIFCNLYKEWMLMLFIHVWILLCLCLGVSSIYLTFGKNINCVHLECDLSFVWESFYVVMHLKKIRKKNIPVIVWYDCQAQWLCFINFYFKVHTSYGPKMTLCIFMF